MYTGVPRRIYLGDTRSDVRPHTKQKKVHDSNKVAYDTSFRRWQLFTLGHKTLGMAWSSRGAETYCGVAYIFEAAYIVKWYVLVEKYMLV